MRDDNDTTADNAFCNVDRCVDMASSKALQLLRLARRSLTEQVLIQIGANFTKESTGFSETQDDHPS